jgi:predicted alpha/beta-fold hydrolase
LDVGYQTPGGEVATLNGFADLQVGEGELLVVLHGLGGSVQSSYVPGALASARRAGLDAVVLNGRGALRPDGSSDGEVSHAGLYSDIARLLSHPRLTHYQQIYLLGYSMGGHLALRYALDADDQRLKAVAAVCSPLDLKRGMEAFDGPAFSVYRRFVLGSLTESRRRFMAASGRAADATGLQPSTIREWDEQVVVPYFGFSSIWQYYESESVAGRLGELSLPALYLGVESDPMVPRHSAEEAFRGASPWLSVHFSERGGHLAFPAEFSLGLPADLGAEPQLIAWLRRASEGRAS